jgi:hypothetical protein
MCKIVTKIPETNYCRSVFRNLFLPTAHPTLTMDRESTPQNFALQKGGTKQYADTRNADPICKALRYID